MGLRKIPCLACRRMQGSQVCASCRRLIVKMLNNGNSPSQVEKFLVKKFEMKKPTRLTDFFQGDQEKMACRHDPVFQEKRCPCKFVENGECLFDRIAAYARASNLRMFNRRSRAFRNKSRR
ncbi:MAG: hypothetical protein ACTSRB_14695 [Candidatus Helarchaeota archaeon]